MRNRQSLASGTGRLLVLRISVAAALGVSAVIHIQLAPTYQQAAPGGIGQGTLFLVQAGTAVLAAVFVLLKGSRVSFAAAAVIGLSSLAAVIIYRYIPMPAIGPLPSMYEPVWYTAKVITAVAEAAAGGLALTGFFLVRRPRQAPRRMRGRLGASSTPDRPNTAG